MKKWKYEILAGHLLLLIGIQINEIEIGSIVGLACLTRRMEELYRQSENIKFRYAWIAGFGTAMVRFTGNCEIGIWRWAGLLAELFYFGMTVLEVCAIGESDLDQRQTSNSFAVWQIAFLIYTAVRGVGIFVGSGVSYAWILSLILLAFGVMLAVALSALVWKCSLARSMAEE